MKFRGVLGWSLVIGLRITAAEPPPAHAFEAEIVAFESADRQLPPPSHPILFVGSSSFGLWTNLAATFPDRSVINRGFGGSKMSDLLYYFDRVVRPYQPQIIAVYEGDNDLASGVPVAEVAHQYGTFLERVQRELPHTPVVFLAVKPSPSRRQYFDAQRALNSAIQALVANHPPAFYADTFAPILNSAGEPDPQWFKSDQLHLNAAGYARWTPVIRAALEQAEKEGGRGSPRRP